MKSTAALLAAPIAAMLLAGCISHRPLTRAQANLPEDQINAAGIFAENCATCHGTDGRAKTFHGRLVGARDLTRPWLPGTSVPEIIKTGAGAMPSFKKKLSESEIEALAVYVSRFQKES